VRENGYRTIKMPPQIPGRCAFRVAGPTAFAEAGITHNDVDHLMIYDAPVRCQGKLCASADLRPRRSGLCAARRRRSLHRRAQHRPGGKLPLNTNGGGLS
jgi:hypothetical protein